MIVGDSFVTDGALAVAEPAFRGRSVLLLLLYGGGWWRCGGGAEGGQEGGKEETTSKSPSFGSGGRGCWLCLARPQIPLIPAGWPHQNKKGIKVATSEQKRHRAGWAHLNEKRAKKIVD
ncbi:hypothetical protein SK128_024515 [Halocaridina rubra]|uniref:Uncharacterized protein n=1 Tax=Halocaridina rubra TaxID=373956 RepID=A0AAN8WJH6_HALRR